MNLVGILPKGALSDDDLSRFIGSNENFRICDSTRLTSEDHRAFSEAEIAFGLIPPTLIERGHSLRWIQLFSVGVESYNPAKWSSLCEDLVCTNLKGLFADPMAQTILAGVLCLYRGLDQLIPLKSNRAWQKDYIHSHIDVLRGERVLLLGGGSVNQRVKELLTPFGCSFTIFGRTSGDIRTLADLDSTLGLSDVICAALPETPQTITLLNASRIARMKPGALFVNVGRGSLVDEPALIEAIGSGKIRGAVLDVTSREPLAAEDPLWACPHIILTQHTSAGSKAAFAEALRFFGVNFERYRRGEALLNVVDWQRGY